MAMHAFNISLAHTTNGEIKSSKTSAHMGYYQLNFFRSVRRFKWNFRNTFRVTECIAGIKCETKTTAPIQMIAVLLKMFEKWNKVIWAARKYVQ